MTDSPPVHPEARNQLDATRARWERYGALVRGDTDDPVRQREDWGTDIAVPALRLDEGRPFTFVAATAGYPWRPEGADAILLFFEPHTRTAALTYDWS
ncbi:hypothetical protein [Streptomyces sp. MAR4 CNX-425]|uniref:hypothetical protein n=1 Tax=Streptomyces sp. MAR4 CNX-425 TaxID=3406343 RepID=UPI003B500A2E